VRVFVSYSHKDASWKDRVVTHLGVLAQQGELDIWDDGRINVGEEWCSAIAKNMEAASVALLLVSANALTSQFILSREVPGLLNLRRDGLTLMPVVVTPCAWEEVEWLEKLEVWAHGLELSTLTEPEVDIQLKALTRQLANLMRYEAQLKSGRLPPPNAMDGAMPPRLEYSAAEEPIERVVDDPLHGYDVLKVVQEGEYGRVLKCTLRATGDTCIVKETDATRVSEGTFEVLAGIRCPNVAAPARVWTTDERLFEQLPYVGGIALEDAVAPGVGGLKGAVLESFYSQATRVLTSLHSVGIVHRDIHPANIYLVVRQPSEVAQLDEADLERTWTFQAFGSGDDAFLLAWVVVDFTFAVLVEQENQQPCLHGPYTPEEQQDGGATTASDIYALGATMYFGATGEDPPSALDRRVNPTAELPPVEPLYLEKYLKGALALDPAERPFATSRLRTGSVVPGFAGVLRADHDRYLLVDQFGKDTELVSRDQALERLDEMNNGWHEGRLSRWITWVAAG